MAADDLIEVQVDGLVGPTHFFGGLSPGNLASADHAGTVSHPRAAARQGLAKMRRVLALGMVQVVLPPLLRPDLALLRACGFPAEPASAVRAAAAQEPMLLRLAQSSAFMWTANCATVAPGIDGDGTTRLVCANLVANAHRAREGVPRARMLRRLLRAVPRLAVIDPLPALGALGDEGAANHCRLWSGPQRAHLFVHGRAQGLSAEDLPRGHPARQSREASAAVARLLALPAHRVVHARQHPAAIDAGAFHNDVVMVADGDRVLVHEQALVEQGAVFARLGELIPGLRVHTVRATELPLPAAVESYLFNAQLLSTRTGRVLLAPAQAGEGPARAQVDRLVAEGFVDRAEFVDLGESMANGGGPACLRLRLPLDRIQLAALPEGVVMDAARLAALETWVDRHYRERLTLQDLADPALAAEGQAAATALERLLGVDGLYTGLQDGGA